MNDTTRELELRKKLAFAIFYGNRNEVPIIGPELLAMGVTPIDYVTLSLNAFAARYARVLSRKCPAGEVFGSSGAFRSALRMLPEPTIASNAPSVTLIKTPLFSQADNRLFQQDDFTKVLGLFGCSVDVIADTFSINSFQEKFLPELQERLDSGESWICVNDLRITLSLGNKGSSLHQNDPSLRLVLELLVEKQRGWGIFSWFPPDGSAEPSAIYSDISEITRQAHIFANQPFQMDCSAAAIVTPEDIERMAAFEEELLDRLAKDKQSRLDQDRALVMVALRDDDVDKATQIFEIHPEWAADIATIKTALKNGAAACLRVLFSLSGKKVNEVQTSLLKQSITQSDFNAIRTLAAAGTDLSLPLDLGRATALHYAKTKDLTETLLAAGADPNATDAAGQTLLHKLPCKSVACLLLENGARPDLKDRSGQTPMDLAAKHRKARLVSVLSNAGVPEIAQERVELLLSLSQIPYVIPIIDSLIPSKRIRWADNTGIAEADIPKTVSVTGPLCLTSSSTLSEIRKEMQQLELLPELKYIRLFDSIRQVTRYTVDSFEAHEFVVDCIARSDSCHETNFMEWKKLNTEQLAAFDKQIYRVRPGMQAFLIQARSSGSSLWRASRSNHGELDVSLVKVIKDTPARFMLEPQCYVSKDSLSLVENTAAIHLVPEGQVAPVPLVRGSGRSSQLASRVYAVDAINRVNGKMLRIYQFEGKGSRDAAWRLVDKINSPLCLPVGGSNT